MVRGMLSTSSCWPPGTSTSTGVPQAPLIPGVFQTCLPCCLSKAKRALLSTAALTMTRSLYRTGLDAEFHWCVPEPASACQSGLPSRS